MRWSRAGRRAVASFASASANAAAAISDMARGALELRLRGDAAIPKARLPLGLARSLLGVGTCRTHCSLERRNLLKPTAMLQVGKFSLRFAHCRLGRRDGKQGIVGIDPRQDLAGYD